MRTVALDLGGRKICYCEIADGKVVLRKTVGKLDELADVLGAASGKARVAIEACREAWHISDVLTSWGNEPVLVDTTRVRQLGIGQHKRKNDRIDAETLARALAQNRIPVAHLLSPARRHLRLKLSVRTELVKTRADYVVTIRGLLRSVGKAPSSCSVKDFSAALDELELDESELQLIAPLRSLLAPLQQQIQRVELELEELVGGDPVIANLATAPGVALIVGAALVSVIDSAKRFANAPQVEAYLGLVPSENTSGKRKLGSITKQGNSYLRALLVQSAWGILKMKDASAPLKRWGKAVEKRRGKKSQRLR